MIETALSLLVLAIIALLAGAIAMWRRGDTGSRKKAGLMVLLAAVMVVNVAMWTLPGSGGQAPLGQQVR
jgi:hypothetical protein